MYRTFAAFFSMMTAAFLFSATAASASTLFTAQLAEAPHERVHIIRRTPWVCDGDSCTTERATSRASYECLRMARELGTITEFTVGGEAFTAEQLAECNNEDS